MQFAKDPSSYNQFVDIIAENVQDEKTKQMAIASAKLAAMFINHKEESEVSIEELILTWWFSVKDIPKQELFLYLVQQARMFSNQGITVDDLTRTDPDSDE